MSPEDFIDEVKENDSTDYGLCPPPVTAEKGMQVLMDHFLGEDWYVVMPLGQEQVYTEAIYAILERNKKPLLQRLFTRKKKKK
jgi:hypothetical protein